MKKLLTTFLGVCAMSTAFAQNYYYQRYTGLKDMVMINTGNIVPGTTATTLLQKTTDNQLSSLHTLPFSVNYYGKSYNSMKVSDNGYITFDNASNTSAKDVVALSDPNAPKNSIFVFWKDWELKSAPNANFPVKVIRATTSGTAPDRRVMHTFFGLSAVGTPISNNATVVNFSITFYESENKFTLTYGGYGSSAFSGLIGCTNEDGTLNVMVDNSTSVAYPAAVDGNGTANYTDEYLNIIDFIYGVQPMNDMSVKSTTLPSITAASTQQSVAGVITNFGSAPVTNFTLNYSINGAAALTQDVTGVNIKGSGGTYNYNHTIKWPGGSVGSDYEFKIWATNVNGMPDDNTANDELTKSVIVNSGITTTRNVIIEEGSGAWCGYCPEGHLILRDILAANPGRVIGVVHHNSDGMTNAESNAVNTAYATGYPYGTIDRTSTASRNQWQTITQQRLGVTSPVKIAIKDKTWDAGTRKITFTVEAEFVDFYKGDLRIGAMIVENNVRGFSDGVPSYDQRNYFSTGPGGSSVSTPYAILSNSPYNQAGYIHEHVVKAIPSTAWGTNGSIPSTLIAKDAKFTQTYTYTLPAATTVSYTAENNNELSSTEDGQGANYPENIQLVGFVAEYHPYYANKRPILNAYEEALWDVAASTTKPEAVNSSFVAYPNPASKEITFNFNIPANGKGVIEITNVVGQVVKTIEVSSNYGSNMLENADISELSNGVYFASVKVGEYSKTVKFNVTK